MPFKIPLSVAGTIISPVLSCCMIAPAHAPSAIHVEILPYQNRVSGEKQRYQPSADQNVDYRAQALISVISITHESECWPPEYYTTHDYFSARDALFQPCANRLKATFKGNYELRDANTKQLKHTSSLTGYTELPHFFARQSGDVALIPTEKQTVPKEPFWASDEDGLNVALHDFIERMKLDIQHHFDQQSMGGRGKVIFH